MRKNKKGWRYVVLVGLLGLVLMAFAPVRDKYFEITKSIELFANAYKQLNAKYVDEIDPADLMKRGLDAMTKSLDPFTRFISETDVENYRLEIDGKYDGIGAKVRLIDDYVTITSMYKDSPAKRAGMRVGDQVLSIDGKDLKGKKTTEVTRIMRGAPGSKVRVRVRNIGDQQERTVEVTRGEVNIPNVPYSGIVRDSIGYINLTTFTQGAGKNVGKALQKMKRDDGVKGVILDLRNNGGGLLREAVNVVNVFNPARQLVVFIKGRLPDSRKDFYTPHAAIDAKIPLVVLVNGHSASASEIVSGVTQDLDRGVLMGQRTYGKGLVQNTFDIGYNSKIKLTTAKYYIPSGRCIQSVYYEHGERRELADSLRTLYRTQKGRKVFGGGAVTPDVRLDRIEPRAVVKDLLRKYLVIKFVSKEWNTLDKLCDSTGCRDDIYPKFIEYLKARHYTFNSKTKQLLADLKTKAKEEGLDEALSESIEQLGAKLPEEQWMLLDKAKEDIIHRIEQEIIGRKYYIEGVTRYRLSYDPEVKKAIELLKNKDVYESILIPDPVEHQ